MIFWITICLLLVSMVFIPKVPEIFQLPTKGSQSVHIQLKGVDRSPWQRECSIPFGRFASIVYTQQDE
ncbi:MAG: hypothetical protein COS40_06810 [Deltaproteobacteria bacterium CG03_land_8_20_14_0_80_45_14]|nr:MAG: hypothetical protein COS40_06810 [Deltaproteobacteria bacterium CG03_land_8_20_14_0_80_45_14]